MHVRRTVIWSMRGVAATLALFLEATLLVELALDLAVAVPELFLVLPTLVPTMAVAMAPIVVVIVGQNRRGERRRQAGGQHCSCEAFHKQ